MRFGKVSLAAVAAGAHAGPGRRIRLRQDHRRQGHAGAAKEESKLGGGSGVIIAVLAAAAVIAGIVIASGNDDDAPTSP